jgi:glycerol uptake facilitator protein
MPRILLEMSAEFAGTLILIMFGVGVTAEVVAAQLGNHDSIAWAWGLGVTFGVYTAARISGAHLNPAVTLALAAFRRFPWRNVLPYVLAQLSGAFVAALVVRWNYSSILAKFDPGHTFKSQIVFSTLPGNGTLPVSLWGGFRDQIIGTALLLFIIFALTDKMNDPPLSNLAPWVIGLVVVGIGMAWGAAAGYAINPARDFGPRLASFITGYSTAFRDQYGSFYWWVPIVAPLLGGLLGSGLYLLLVGRLISLAMGVTPPGRAGVETPPDGSGKAPDPGKDH